MACVHLLANLFKPDIVRLQGKGKSSEKGKKGSDFGKGKGRDDKGKGKGKDKGKTSKSRDYYDDYSYGGQSSWFASASLSFNGISCYKLSLL